MPNRIRIAERFPWREAALIAGAYIAAATGWILLSDYVSRSIAGGDIELLSKIERLKGVAFVAITGIVLFLAVCASIRRRQRLDAEKRQAEAMLAVSTKYETLGQFAATLAHDFNNIITAIGMATEMVETGNGAVRKMSIDTIHSSVKQAQKSVATLMHFARRAPEEAVDYDVGLTLKENLGLLQQVLGKRYNIDLKLPAEPLVVKGAPDMLLQAIINLAANARDAMEGRQDARITISLERKTLRRYRSAFNSAPASGDFAMLSVADGGCGIPAEHLPLIFAPLFTTKPVGKGTGLGLASTLYAVRHHLGWIEVDSKVGTGSTFSLYLPLAPT